MTPPFFTGEDTLFYTEEDFARAYPGRKQADVAIDFGTAMLLAEVVSSQLTVGTRVEGDVEAFRRDADKLIFDKCRQLDDCARSVLEDALTLQPAVVFQRRRRMEPDLSSRRGPP